MAEHPEEAEYLREERAAILEYEAGLDREEAERRAGLSRDRKRSNTAGPANQEDGPGLPF